MSKKELWYCFFLYRVRPSLWCMAIVLMLKFCMKYEPLGSWWANAIVFAIFGTLAMGFALLSVKEYSDRYREWRWHLKGYHGKPWQGEDFYVNEQLRLTYCKDREVERAIEEEEREQQRKARDSERIIQKLGLVKVGR